MMKAAVVFTSTILLFNASQSFAMGKSRTQISPPEPLVQESKLKERVRHPIHVKKTPSKVVPSGLSPAKVRKVYGLDQVAATGAGQKIGIIVAFGSPTIEKDLQTFSRQFKLPPARLRILYPQGAPDPLEEIWALETSLDVEWAHAIAPEAEILLVVAKNAEVGNLLEAVDVAVANGANQVSMSWGTGEFSWQDYFDTHFQAANVTFTAASGDWGTGVLWPAVSPSVLGVGGTTLQFDYTGSVLLGETAWYGSGGGISAYEEKPSYQTLWQPAAARTVPDVSYNADPYTGFSVYHGTRFGGSTGWFVVGGTSAGAPQWAALLALVNSTRSSPLGELAHWAVYGLSDPSLELMYFRDVVLGCNSGYVTWETCAQTGYDAVTGVGSPLGNYLIPRLATY